MQAKDSSLLFQLRDGRQCSAAQKSARMLNHDNAEKHANSAGNSQLKSENGEH
jgi:hypothetical protein